MENELVKRYIKMAKAYKDTPRQRTEVLFPFYQELLAIPQKELQPLVRVSYNLGFIKKKTNLGEVWQYCGHNCDVFLNATRLAFLDRQTASAIYIGCLDFDLLCRLLTLHCPSWFSDLINNPDGFAINQIDYYEYMELHRRGFVKEVKPELIARKVANLTKGDTHGEYPDCHTDYSYDRLWQDERIMKEYIWYLLEYETAAPNIDDSILDDLKAGRTTEDMTFAALFARCARQGKMDRTRLLRACVEGYLRGFSDTQNAWHTGILKRLDPQPGELLPLQDTLLKTLAAPGLRTILPQLKLLKTLAAEPAFHAEAYVDAVAPLLHTLPQNALTVILSTCEVLTKARQPLRPLLCHTAGLLLMSPQMPIQQRAARLIARHGDPADDALRADISACRNELWTEVREMLGRFITPATAPAAPEKPFEPEKAAPVCTDGNRITPPQTKDDFIFLFSRLPDRPSATDLWTAIGAAVDWFPQLDRADLDRLQSVFARAFDAGSGYVYQSEDMLATFILEYGSALERRLQPQPTGMRRLLGHLRHTVTGEQTLMGRPYKRLSALTFHRENGYPEALRNLLAEAIDLLGSHPSRPLLSSPTHLPYYIDPRVLIGRMAKHHLSERQMPPFDLQLAISRCAKEYQTEALAMAREQLDGEARRLMLFLLDDGQMPAGPFTMQAAWVGAGLVKAPDTEFATFEGFSLNLHPHRHLSGAFSLSGQSDENARQKTLHLGCSRKHLRQTFKPQLWQEYLCADNTGGTFPGETDILMSLFPNRPEPLLAQVIENYLDLGTTGGTGRQIITAAIGRLRMLRCELRDLDLLFLAACLVHADVTVRALAAELWAERTAQGTIDNDSLSRHLLDLTRRHLYPLSRLSKVIAEQLTGRSAHHDAQLRLLLAPVADLLATHPQTGSKQLLPLISRIR